MAAKYGNSEAFSMKVQMIKSLAFLPANEVSAYYSSLSSDDESDLNQLGAWFEKNYIGGVNTRPKYKPEFWTCGAEENNVECFPRTQNGVETWHRRLKVIVGKRHAGLYEIISQLSKELIVAKHRADKIKSGENQPKKRDNIKKK